MVGRGVAGETAVVLVGVHRLPFLAGFLSEGVGAGGICRRIDLGNPLLFLGRTSYAGEKIKTVFFCHSKRDELISKNH